MIPLRDNLRCSVFPIATLLLIALNCAAFFVELMVMSSGSPDTFFNTWTMVPATVVHAFRLGDAVLMGMALVTMFTSMFLHAGWMHIIGNMLYLYAFGRGLEARLGHTRYIVFYLLSGLVAAGFHIASDPASTISVLGASGAIAGVLGGYLLFWPTAEIKGIFLVGIFPLPFTARAYWYLAFWFVMQLASVFASAGQVGEGGGVAYWAHIGGFVGGLVFAALWRLYQPVSDACYMQKDCSGCPTDSCPDEDNELGNESR